MILHIKNMVCNRCIMVVSQQLENLGFEVCNISLGTAEILPDPDEQTLLKLSSILEFLGFELIRRDKDWIVEQIKNLIIGLIHHSNLKEIHIPFTELISSELNKDYTYLSK